MIDFFKRLFGRKASGPKDCRDGAPGWQIGDLAECIKDDLGIAPTGFRPKKGERYFVTDVADARGIVHGHLATCLFFPGSANFGYNHINFRKVKPPEIEKRVPRKARVPETVAFKDRAEFMFDCIRAFPPQAAKR